MFTGKYILFPTVNSAGAQHRSGVFFTVIEGENIIDTADKQKLAV